MSYIEIQNVQKYYKKNKVLDVESLKINKNEIVAFLGKNGSGDGGIIMTDTINQMKSSVSRLPQNL